MAKTTQKPKAAGGMSERAKRITLASLGCVALVGGVWWAYFKFTTIPPPDVKVTAPSEVVNFLGDGRGFSRMSIDRRQEYLTSAWKQYNQGPGRQQFIQAMNRMSSSEKQVLFDAVFDITHVRVVQMAKEYNELPVAQRDAYVDKAVKQIEEMRNELGGGSKENSVGEPLKQNMPTASDDLAKVLVTRTSGQERAEAKPFVDKMVAKYKATQDANRSSPRG